MHQGVDLDAACCKMPARQGTIYEGNNVRNSEWRWRGKEDEEKQEEEELDAISRDCYVVVECSAAANGLAISCTRSPVLTNSLFRRYIQV